MSRNFVISFLLFLLHSLAWGQHWNIVSVPNISNYQLTPYFLNENIGFVFDASFANPSNLRRTIDGGMTWASLRFFDDQNLRIEQFYFTEVNHGYAAASDGVYETQDTGSSWRKIYSVDSYNDTTSATTFINSIYSYGNKIFALSKSSLRQHYWSTFIMTANDGTTWDTILTANPVNPQLFFMIQYIFGNKDSMVFVKTYDSLYDRLIYSTNNGEDWHTTIIDSIDNWNNSVTMGLFSFPHCKDILRTSITVRDLEHYVDDYHIMHSSDFGIHWDTLFYPIEIGGWIAGNNCVQYVSDALGSQNGGNSSVWRSQDHGKNWALINGGPNFTEIDDGNDFHNLSVVGGGAVVYAADIGDSGRLPNLWKTTDGGDGSLSMAAFASLISLDHHLDQGNSACDTSNLNIFFQNLSCNYTLLKHFTIEGLDSAQYSSQWQHHLACDDIPDSLLVKIFPFYPGFGTFTFHGQFMNDEYQIIDTSFTFTLLSRPGEFAGIYLKSLPLGRKAGDTIEIPIYINSTQSPAQTGTISVTLTYFLNTNLLTPLEFIPISGVIADPVQTTKTTATVTLHFDQGFTFSGETELGRLRCVAYVTDTLETDIILNAHSSGCLATLADSNVTHFTLTGCGATTLSNFMKFGTAYNILSIIPNPANNSVLIMLKNNGSLLNYELLNPLGLVQKTGTTTGSKLQINLSGLSSGNYYFRLSGEGGIPITEKLVIMK